MIILNIKGHKISLKKLIFLFLYYIIANKLPKSGAFFNIGGKFRYFCCRRIFKYCGKYVNIDRNVNFGVGINIELGDYSGMGLNSVIPSNTIIGKYVMMGPNCYILDHNHKFDDLSTPMIFQGKTGKIQTVIEDNVWIGRNVTITPGRVLKSGSIVAACCVLCRDFPAMSIIGGNPSRLIRLRTELK